MYCCIYNLCHLFKVGLWKFKIHQTAKDSQKVRLTVISSSSHERHDSINVKTSVKITSQGPNIVSMHVDVTQGVHPVVGLNVSAYVETPGHKTLTLQLFDNGAGLNLIVSKVGLFLTCMIFSHDNR